LSLALRAEQRLTDLAERYSLPAERYSLPAERYSLPAPKAGRENKGTR